MTQQVERMLPLYQGMMTSFYDHRAADVVASALATKRQNQPRYLTDQEKADPNRVVLPHYWVRAELIPSEVPPWLIAFSDITSPTNQRSLVPVALPRVAVNNKLPLILSDQQGSLRVCLLACLSSFAVDFVARQKVGGTTLNYFYLRQFAVPPPASFEGPTPWMPQTSLQAWIAARVRSLVYTSRDMSDLAGDMDWVSEPMRWDPAARRILQAELDAAMFHLFGVVRDDVDYIMETFPIVKRKDLAEFGTFRTKDMILEIYDAMQAAIDSGTPYDSPVDLPPVGRGGLSEAAGTLLV